MTTPNLTCTLLPMVASVISALPSSRHCWPMRVVPRRITLGPITVSRPICTSGPMYAVAGSSSVTPAAIHFAIDFVSQGLLPRCQIGSGADLGSLAAGGRRVADACTLRARHPDDVRQIQLALGVRRFEPFQRAKQEVGIDAVDADVDLTDRALRRAAIAVLDDADDAALLVAHDATEPGRIVDRFGQQRHRQPVPAGARRSAAGSSRDAGTAGRRR